MHKNVTKIKMPKTIARIYGEVVAEWLVHEGRDFAYSTTQVRAPPRRKEGWGGDLIRKG